MVSDFPCLSYGVGSWDSDEHGNHRAVLEVQAQADAVAVRIPWRRRDACPEGKAIWVCAEATGERVRDAWPVRVTREYGDLIFRPEAGAGTYFVYFMPYAGSVHSPYPKIAYVAPEDTADGAWKEACRVRLEAAGEAPADVFPGAVLRGLESAGEFERFTDMELIATAAEMERLLREHPNAPFLVFPETAGNSVRMEADLPCRWALRGPGTALTLTVARGEFAVFQVGVFAAHATLPEVTLRFGDFVADSGNGRIGSGEARCFNTDGTHWDGSRIRKTIRVPEGRIQALWCGVSVPRDMMAGPLRSTVRVEAPGIGEAEFELVLVVTGEEIAACGDRDPDRLSRLRWLDSQLGTEDEVVPPYVPVGYEEVARSVLGRRIVPADTGLPARITSFFNPEVTGIEPGPGREILAGPVVLALHTAAGERIVPTGCRLVSEERGVSRGVRTMAWQLGPFDAVCRARIEFDGTIDIAIRLEAREDAELDDIRLEIPMGAGVARYMLGVGRKGGFCPESFEWVWNREFNQDSLWLGDVNAGLQVSLRDETYSRPLNTNFYRLKPLNLPRSWANDGRGGIRWHTDAGSGVRTVACTSGARHVARGEELHFDVRFLVTPFKPIDTRAHFRTRFHHRDAPPREVAESGANVINVHHATPVNPYINYPLLRIDALREYVEDAHRHGCRAKIYYTVRELTTRAPELFALRSLGDEVFVPGPGGGHAWLLEHFAEPYIAAWYSLPTRDTSVIDGVLSRRHNFYIEGLDFVARETGIDGIYLDDLGFGREMMQRMRRVLARRCPAPLIDLHSANQYNERDGFASSMNLYLENLPYVDRLWFGEYFDYDSPPDYWLVEMSGIPFGLMSEMLQDGGNPYRGMVFGMTGRAPRVDNGPLWEFWDEVGLPDMDMIGWWSPNCPVRADRPEVMATAYVGTARSVVAVAVTAGTEAVTARLTFAAGILADGRAPRTVTVPEITGFQESEAVGVGEPLTIQPGRGFLLIIE